MRVMPAAPSREPSARRAWSIRKVTPSWTGTRSLAARTWSGHRLFLIVAIPAVLLRVDAELGYRYSNYTTSGGTSAYKLSGDLRTLYGTVLGPTARALYLSASA